MSEIGKVSAHEDSAVVDQRKDSAVTVGYWLAFLFPMVGVLVGTSLISRNSDKGPRIVVLSVVSLIAWVAILVIADEISPGLFPE